MGNAARLFTRSRASALAASALVLSPSLAPLGAPPAADPADNAPPPPQVTGTDIGRGVFGKKSLLDWVAALFLPGGGNASPVLPPAPGGSMPWEPAFPVRSGSANLATGNLNLVHRIAGWDSVGPSVEFAAVFNSQAPTTPGPLGPKWRHTYMKSVSGVSPAVVAMPCGRAHAFALAAGEYQAPAGVDLSLVRNPDLTWRLTTRDRTEFRFDSAGRLTEVRDRNDNAKTLAYDGAGRLVSVTDPAGRTLQIQYNAQGRIASVSDFENRTWTVSYDAAGRPAAFADPPLGNQQFQTQFAYNAAHNVVGLTDRLGNTWTYAYSGNVFLSSTAPGGGTSGVVFRLPGNDEFDVNGFSSQEEEEDTPDPDPHGATWPTDTARIAYTENETGNAVEYGLDAAGRITAVRNPVGQQTNFVWNADNRRTQTVEPGGATTTVAYDSRGNVVSVADPLGRISSATYDAQNNLLTQTDPLDRTTTHTYDSRGNRTSTTDPTGAPTAWTYNADGTVAAAFDPLGNATTFSYNTFGELVEVRDPLQNAETYVRANGRVVSRTDARGRTTQYGYDAWGRLVSIDYPHSVDQSFVYDAEGRLLSATDGTGTRTFAYNPRGLRISQTDPRGTTAATYDLAGRMLTQTDVTGRQIQYQYDSAGRLVQILDPSGWVQYAYDARGRKVSAVHSNGIVSTYTYDAASQLVGLVHRQGANGPVVASFAGTYDAAGRLVQTVEGPVPATTTKTYDPAGRLLTENRAGANPYVSTYAYDVRGLRATAFRSENGVVSHDGTYTYDAAGRLTLVTQPGQPDEVYVWNADSTLASLPGPGHIRNLAYDEEGRMVSLSRGQTPAYEFGYAFDGARRWTRDVATDRRTWLPCGVRCSAGELAELASTDGGQTWGVASTNLTAPGCGGLVRAGDQILLRDLRGAASRAVSPTGTVVATAVFDAFGVLRHGTGTLAPAAVREAYGSDDLDGLKTFLAGRGLFLGKIPKACRFCLLLKTPPKVGLCLAVCTAASRPRPSTPPGRRPPGNNWQTEYMKCFKGCVLIDCYGLWGDALLACESRCAMQCIDRHVPKLGRKSSGRPS